MKKFLSSLGLLIIILQLSACSLFGNNNSKNPILIEKDQYINYELDFSLKIPSSLASYKTKTEKNIWTGGLPTEAIVVFGLPTNDINWPTFDSAAFIFQIQVYKLADWKNLAGKQIDLPQVILTSEKYVYTYRESNDFPYDVKVNPEDIKKAVNSLTLIKSKKIQNIDIEKNNEIPQGDD